jgi:hypothetical protein
MLVYYAACRTLYITAGIGFAIGFLIAWPVTVPLACRLQKGQTGWVTLMLGVASFTLYFWSSALLVIMTGG